jgi:hypothetical protein
MKTRILRNLLLVCLLLTTAPVIAKEAFGTGATPLWPLNPTTEKGLSGGLFIPGNLAESVAELEKMLPKRNWIMFTPIQLRTATVQWFCPWCRKNERSGANWMRALYISRLSILGVVVPAAQAE